MRARPHPPPRPSVQRLGPAPTAATAPHTHSHPAPRTHSLSPPSLSPSSGTALPAPHFARRALLDSVASASLPADRPAPSLAESAAPAPAAAATAPVTGEEEEEEGGPPVNGQKAVNTDVGSSPLAATVLGAVGGIPTNSSVFYTPLAGPLKGAAAKPLPFQARQRGWEAPKMSKPSSVS